MALPRFDPGETGAPLGIHNDDGNSIQSFSTQANLYRVREEEEDRLMATNLHSNDLNRIHRHCRQRFDVGNISVFF
jgi:hypothetical protein